MIQGAWGVRTAVVVGVLAALAVDARPAASEEAPAATTAADTAPLNSHDVQWSSLPTGWDIAHVYPREAKRRNISGGATIVCRITADHTLDACRALKETPADLGFGEAAISLGPRFRLRAEQRDPRAIAGAEVVIEIGFRVWG
jgi:protein TonB